MCRPRAATQRSAVSAITGPPTIAFNATVFRVRRCGSYGTTILIGGYFAISCPASLKNAASSGSIRDGSLILSSPWAGDAPRMAGNRAAIHQRGARIKPPTIRVSAEERGGHRSWAIVRRTGSEFDEPRDGNRRPAFHALPKKVVMVSACVLVICHISCLLGFDPQVSDCLLSLFHRSRHCQ